MAVPLMPAVELGAPERNSGGASSGLFGTTAPDADAGVSQHPAPYAALHMARPAGTRAIEHWFRSNLSSRRHPPTPGQPVTDRMRPAVKATVW